MRKLRFVAVLAGLAISFGSAAQHDSTMLRNIVEDVLVRGAAYENLRFLCKKVGPRLSGSPGGVAAVKEAARMMRELGAEI
jgi:hypothetical protein